MIHDCNYVKIPKFFLSFLEDTGLRFFAKKLLLLVLCHSEGAGLNLGNSVIIPCQDILPNLGLKKSELELMYKDLESVGLYIDFLDKNKETLLVRNCIAKYLKIYLAQTTKAALNEYKKNNYFLLRADFIAWCASLTSKAHAKSGAHSFFQLLLLTQVWDLKEVQISYANLALKIGLKYKLKAGAKAEIKKLIDKWLAFLVSESVLTLEKKIVEPSNYSSSTKNNTTKNIYLCLTNPNQLRKNRKNALKPLYNNIIAFPVRNS